MDAHRRRTTTLAVCLLSLTPFDSFGVDKALGPQRVRRPVVHADVPYYPGASTCTPSASAPCASVSTSSTQCLDVWRPAVIAPSTPTILFVHGGGWGDGDKADPTVDGFLKALSDMGYGVVSCNYTLACDDPSTPQLDAPSFPQAIVDVRAAIGWIRTEGASAPFGLSECVVVVGASAGAHLTAMVGALNGFEEVFFPAEYAGSDLSVQLAITFSADFDTFRRACTTSACACTSSQCPLSSSTEPHLAGLANDDQLTERFVGEQWGVAGDEYVPFGCPSGTWDHLALAPQTLTSDPFLNASPVHWFSTESAPVYAFHSHCDPFWPTAEIDWLLEVADRYSVPAEARIESCGHALRIYEEIGSALQVDEILRTWNGYTRCP